MMNDTLHLSKLETQKEAILAKNEALYKYEAY